MSNTQILLTIIVLMFSSILEGINNSLITSKQGFDAFGKFNKHIIFVLQRSCFVLLFFILLNLKSAMIISVLYTLIFSFFHNGFYGVSMKKLGFRNYSFTYTPSTSTSKIELNFAFRSFLLILAVLILIVKLTTN